MFDVIYKSNSFKVKRGMEDSFEAVLSNIQSEGEFIYTRDEDDNFQFASQGDFQYHDGSDYIEADDLLELFASYVGEDSEIYMVEFDYEKILHSTCVVTKISHKGIEWFNVTRDFDKLFNI